MSTSSPFADPPENAPEGDAFFNVPAELPPGNHGDPIYQRLLDNETAKLSRGRNWLVLYHSQDAHDNPIAVSGIIVLPTDPPKTEAGYPVVSWAHGTVGVAHKCAPSRDWPASDTHPMNAYAHNLLNGFLDQGWAVAMTDYEGLGVARGQSFYRRHPFMHGKSQANGVLDIVLTARRLFGGQISDQFAISGHSQGGQAALFAASHAPGRVSGLAGVAAIAPASHTLDVVKAGAYLPIPNEGLAFTPLFLARRHGRRSDDPPRRGPVRGRARQLAAGGHQVPGGPGQGRLGHRHPRQYPVQARESKQAELPGQPQRGPAEVQRPAARHEPRPEHWRACPHLTGRRRRARQGRDHDRGSQPAPWS